jgi:hypothetical protein
MPRGANAIFICPILMAMSFHLLVRATVGNCLRTFLLGSRKLGLPEPENFFQR